MFVYICFAYLIVFAFAFAFAFNPITATNVPTEVLELNDKFLEVMNQGLWFVEFYAPWCGHCKRLAPIWEQVGHNLAEANRDIRVAKLDCTRFTSVASTLDIHGFPSIIFFRNGKRINYEGDRTKEALLDFAMKTAGPEVRQISGGVRIFHGIKDKYAKGVFFVLVNSENDKESALEKEYYESAKKMFSITYFFETSAANLPETVQTTELPAIFVFKEGRHFQFDEASGQSMNSWIHNERWPVFPQITHGNMHDIGNCCDKMLVVVVSDVVDFKKSTTTVGRFHKMLHNLADNMRQSTKYQFGWLDGNEIANSIILGTVPIPGVIVFNVSSYEYYLCDDSPDQMTQESIQNWLNSIETNQVKPLGGHSINQRIKRMLYEIFSTIYAMFATQPLLTCCLFGLPLGFLAVICYSICSADFSVEHEEVYPDTEDDDTDTEDHEKVE